MLTYVYFGTNDLPRATRFYDATLTPLGMQRCLTGDRNGIASAGWGTYENDGAHELAFWIGRPFDERPATTGNGAWLPSELARGKKSTAAVPKAHPLSGHTTTRIFTPRTCVIRMAIESRPFVAALQNHHKRWTSAPSALTLTVGPVPVEAV